ncbi:non-ribosomal peptide synthetase/type I polyketide synthase [Ruegeria arenilitoris]|uniref:non-ribosomal peptide synthetase/type I polyketide synthase n=1 Tax=Ruegeria arenilitoris TaxID=1173585 RepID=UPI00147C0F63|nr:non-ribosomal peptide synthetase/type I polyketide synthase [Ruegeria arenilitoris]
MLSGSAVRALGSLNFDPQLDLYQSFLRVCQIVPEAIALMGDGRQYTYAEMVRAADRIAAHLINRGVVPGDNVVMITDRTPEAILTMCGIMQAGCTYVPLDPAYDSKQLGYVVGDSKPTVILWDDPYEVLATNLADDTIPQLKISEVLETDIAIPQEFPRRTGEDACYIMYTSGSTGQPKGVVLPHRAISRLGYDQPTGQMRPGDISLANSTIACDVSTWEIWVPLLNGGSVAVVTEPKPALDALAETITRYNVNVAYFYTGLSHLMIEHHLGALKGLREFGAGGDVLSPSHVRQLMEAYPYVQVVNGYGPTENSVFTTMHLVTADDLKGGSIPIGLPTGHCECFVVDEDYNELPIGTVGQLVAAGPGVASEYLNKPDRTAESFIPDPRQGRSGQVYLTGDLARCREDGVYEFLGRVDRQVKIGGRRIELDEIEHHLREIPMLVDAAVALVVAKTGEKRIAAFLKPSGEMPADHRAFISDVMAELGKVLPEGCLPRMNRVLADFPLTVNSKIDRKALVRSVEDPESDSTPDTVVAFRSKRKKRSADEVFGVLAKVYDEHLGCGPLDKTATFFEAGGTSLQLISAHAEVMKRLGLIFDISLVFETPRLGSLSQAIAELAVDAPVETPSEELRPAAVDETATQPNLPEDAIAVVGMAAKLPGADSLETFWQHIQNGDNLIRPFKADELEDGFSEAERSKDSYVPVRPGLPDGGMFDAKFFGMHAREAAVTDPQARVFMEICYHALEDSGHDPWRMGGTVGVYAGCSMNTYLIHNVLGDRKSSDAFTSNYQTGKFSEMTGNLSDCLATRVSYKLDLKGPAMTVLTACSSSLTAISQAMTALRSGQCDMALAGGVSITFPQNRGYITQEGGLASDDGTCRPFDAQASGTIFGHGAGVVVLRRLKDAVADGDHIHAVIRGCGINNDGSEKISYTAPTVLGQADAIRRAHQDAGISADTVSYVECHGTATPLGDPIEIKGLRQAFADASPEGGCALGSVKGNIGHLDAAAGVVGVIKTALMLTHRSIPPVANFNSLNPRIDLDGSGFRVPKAASNWVSDGPLRAGVSSFGVGGTNVHLVMEEAPDVPHATPSKSAQVIVLSAKTPEALAEMQNHLVDALEQPNAYALADIAYTLQDGRAEFEFRQAVAGTDKAEVAKTLRAAPAVRKPAMQGDPSVAFMFPGQGSQYPSMGSGLYRSEPEFARWIDQGAEILRPVLGLDVKTMLCFGDPSDQELARALRETRLTQPALFLTQYACARLWMARGVTPAAMIGHSVGEFTAAALGGVMDFETGLSIIAKRGQLMQDQPGGAMLSVRAPLEALEDHLDDTVDVAARNAPRLNVLAGDFDAIAAMEERLKKADIPCSRLHTSHAFHSRMMDPVCDGLMEAVSERVLQQTRIPYVSCVTGDWISEDECTDPSYWATQARAAVNFADAVSTLVGEDAVALLEVGAGNTLSAFSAQTLPRDASVAIIQSLPDHTRPETDEVAMATAMGRLWGCGVSVDWEKLGSRGNRRVPLPTYPFQRKLHWVDAPAPCLGIPTGASTDPTAVPVNPVSSVSEISSMPTSISQEPIDRKPRLIGEIMAILSEVSGEDLGAEDASATFLELGFDSLFLGQVTQQMNTDYGVDLTFRQLLSDYPSAQALVNYLDECLPAETAALSVEQETSQAVPQGAVAQVVPAASPPPAAPSVPMGDGSVAAVMQAQVAAMQSLFAQQLQALSGAQAEEPTAPVSTPKVAAEDKPLVPAPAKTAAKKTAFSIGRATNAAGGDLTPQQLAFAQDLAGKYSQRYAKSKEYVQTYRSVMADPRTAAGFRSEWKELVFPIVCERSKGARLWDIDGNELIDLVSGFGPIAFGHSPDFIIDAITRQMELGFAIGPQCDLAGPVLERFAKFVGHERATFCNTGSEAVMAAMRIARTVTGRDQIVVFGNDYHGQFDEVLVKGKSRGGDPAALPIAPGIPRSSLSNMVVLPYGAPESLDWIRENIGAVAAVVVEPVQSRNPTLRPKDFVRELRHITHENGAALVMDEIVTGFRVGARGMQGEWDIQADMATYGKVIGGGMPIGMLAGSARFMDALDGGMWQFGDDSVPEASPTFFAGTFVRHPLVVAAVDATLDHMETNGSDLWQRTAARTADAVERMNVILEARGLPRLVESYSSWFVPKLMDFDPNAALFYPLMKMAGIHVQVGYACFFTTAHTEQDFDAVVTAFEQSVDALRNVGILTGDGQAEPAAAVPVATPPTEGIPLTEAQREVWMTSQLGEKASCSFNESASFYLTGQLDKEALQRALNLVVERHDGLRQVFARNGETFDIIDPFELPLTLHDLSERENPEAALADILHEDSATEIDLISGPPLRAFLARMSAEEHVLVINAHHIVCDGWSYNVLGSDLVAFYKAEVAGTCAELPPAPSFASYAIQQSGKDVRAETRAYWQEQYAEPTELPEIPTDRSRPAIKTFSGATCTAHISGDVAAAARKAGAAQGCTLFATLFASLQIVFGRLTGSHDLVLGVPTGGQALLDDSDMVGHCVNFLPIRTIQDPNATAADFLVQVRDRVMNAFDHQDYTYGTLVRDLNIERTLNRLPLTEVQFNLERLGEAVDMGSLSMTTAPNPKTAVNFDLFFNVIERRDGLRVDVDYNTDVYDEDTVMRWIKYFETALTELAADTTRPLSEITIQPAYELEWMLETVNQTSEELPQASTLHRLISETAKTHPEVIAVEDSKEQLSYMELDRLSDAVAADIQALVRSSGGRIAVAMSRSSQCLAALLGVLKSGNAYVPIDPAQPASRLRMILETADVSAILHDQTDLPDCAEGLDLRELQMSQVRAGGSPSFVAGKNDPTAYVMFTSGSTGTPKGVEIGHRSVINLLTSMADEPGFDAQSVMLSVTTTMFDISVLELFLPLLQGGRLVIAEQEDVLDGFRLVERLKRGDVTHIQATPTLWSMLLEAGLQPDEGLTMLAGGEPLPADLAERLMENGADLWNMYGPTETTIWSAVSKINSGELITIGHPIANTELHVLGPDDQPLPIGAEGELNIGGTGLAKGYFRREDLTNAAFREVSLNGQSRMLYKTGDVARRLVDGTIQVLGRNDGQVKLRGFRIELGEIEAAMRTVSGVQFAAAALRPSPRGDKQLVGYVVSEPGYDPKPEDLTMALGHRLPNYMVPTAWVFLSDLPKTGNKKLDRKALPDPDVVATVTVLYTEPSTPTEKKMAKIWEETLGIEQISTSQTLFALGADSLTVFRIAARLIDADLNVEARHLLEYPSIARLAAFADSRVGDDNAPRKPSLKSYRRGARRGL